MTTVESPWDINPHGIVKVQTARYNRAMSPGLPFTKMHGLGNDFVVIDGRMLGPHDLPSLARAMCDRHFGIGADQLLLVENSNRADLRMRLFNTDGFEAEMCGNGIRCVGKFAFERGIVSQASFDVETLGGNKRLELLLTDNTVTGARVSMGVPHLIFQDEYIDLDAQVSDLNCLQLTAVDMGNPHAVALLCQPVSSIDLQRLGPLVEHHSRFPYRTNFEIVNVESRNAITMRVWERSAGITMACGTGACASVVAARTAGLVGDAVSVRLPGGTLQIEWDGRGDVYMTGPATQVFEGLWCETGR